MFQEIVNTEGFEEVIISPPPVVPPLKTEAPSTTVHVQFSRAPFVNVFPEPLYDEGKHKLHFPH